ncbi:MAG TPA: hypothetical protein VG146_11080 [Verrucomicrobiae bacterium]|nr:hypothetical protein [Verrucomicrobiae bacterium]
MANCRVDVRGLNRPKSQQGIALVITLILLSVITFMAIAFLVLSQGQKGNVATYTDQSLAKLAADTAFQQAQAQLMAPILAYTNPFAVGLLVSTNYVNPAGFFPGLSSPTNVNYDFVSGTLAPLTQAQQLQNLTNLLFSPRPPVFISNPVTGSNDFRYYLDLNRNGFFEPTGWLYVTNALGRNFPDSSGNLANSYFTGDPQWIGGLAFPDRPHSANNEFIYRYAYLVAPASETMDINYIHNYAKNLSPATMPPGTDSLFRNQGVGTWEINLGAFLADLNTNLWDNGAAPYNYRGALPTLANTGAAFDDALAILKYRYNGSKNTLHTVRGLFGVIGANAFGSDYIDGYSDGPLMTNTWWPAPPDADFNRVGTLAWSGDNNTNHIFSMQELFDRTKFLVPGSATFSDRLAAAGTNVDSYNRYTFYRLLSSLGTESAPESGKINLNYKNVDNFGNVVPNIATNFIPWTNAEQFVTNVATRLMANAGYSVGIGLTNLLYKDNNGTTELRIQIWPTNFYTASVHRYLQLAANIYDATTNRTFLSTYPFCPTVLRPVFRRLPPQTFQTPFGPTNVNVVMIVGYAEVLDASMVRGPRIPLQVDLANTTQIQQDIPLIGLPFRGVNAEPMVSGVPMVIGAKKGFPNFNEFSMQTYFYVSRLLEFRRNQINGPVTQTNVMYVATITNIFGLEAWNSYQPAYTRNLELIAAPDMRAILTNTNDAGRGSLLLSNTAPVLGVRTNIGTWPGWTNVGLAQYSFVLPYGTNANFFYLPESSYVDNNGRPYFEQPMTHIFPVVDRGKFPVPRWSLTLNTRLVFALVDTAANRIVDYVNLNNWDPPLDINSTLIYGADCSGNPSSYTDPGAQWCTNRQFNLPTTPTQGILNQIGVCMALNGQLPPPASFNQDPYLGLDGESAIDFFRYNLKGWGPAFTQDNGKVFYRSNIFYAPYDPYRPIFIHTTWQANDPLVHYTIGDLTDLVRTNVDFFSRVPPLDNLGQINNRYQPWGGNPLGGSTPSIPATQMAAKDPLVTRSDAWDFPTNKFPNVGWLGRVHRGTPWQTIFLKSTNILFQAGYTQPGMLQSLGAWQAWSGNPVTNINWGQFSNLPYFGLSSTNPLGGIVQDAIFTLPTNDWRILDLFTTSFNDNAARGKLSVNNTNLAAWSAVLGGVNVMPDLTANGFITPAGPYSLTAPLPPLVQVVNGIINSRTNFPNNYYQKLGDILATPQLTVASPYLVGNPGLMNDAVVERIPQQILGLLHGGDAPRFVIYSYGQALKPAAHSLVTSGAYLDLCTNYQITAESATRAVVRIDGLPNNPHAVVESFNVLPPD